MMSENQTLKVVDHIVHALTDYSKMHRRVEKTFGRRKLASKATSNAKAKAERKETPSASRRGPRVRYALTGAQPTRVMSHSAAAVYDALLQAPDGLTRVDLQASVGLTNSLMESALWSLKHAGVLVSRRIK